MYKRQSLFSGSKYQIGGPTGAFVIIILGVLEQYHASGLRVCTLMAGLFLIILGFCRMGALIRFSPFPFTTGFTSGIAVVIFSTQIKDIFGPVSYTHLDVYKRQPRFCPSP